MHAAKFDQHAQYAARMAGKPVNGSSWDRITAAALAGCGSRSQGDMVRDGNGRVGEQVHPRAAKGQCGKGGELGVASTRARRDEEEVSGAGFRRGQLEQRRRWLLTASAMKRQALLVREKYCYWTDYSYLDDTHE